MGGDVDAILMETDFGKRAEYADCSSCAPRSAGLHLAVQSLHFVHGDLLRILAWKDMEKSEVQEEVLSREG